MRTKVSMVIPCYNKVKFISEMFDSVLVQKWDNIELVIVNDGSTDGTREIIAAYKPKFIAQGFEVNIIDQDNQGVAAAVLNGLKGVAGEYVCMPDCDDILDAEYVSKMAAYLDEHSDTEWVTCNFDTSEFFIGTNKALTRNNYTEAYEMKYPLAETLMTFRGSTSVCCRMIRTSHLLNCGLDKYSLECRTSQEPGLMGILVSKEDKPVCLPYVLYHCIKREGSISAFCGEAQRLKKHYIDWFEAVKESVEKMCADEKRKSFLTGCIGISVGVDFIACVNRSGTSVRPEFENKELVREEAVAFLAKTVSEHFQNIINATEQDICRSGTEIFHRAISNRIIGFRTVASVMNYQPNLHGRIIAYGYGRTAHRILPYLMQTPFRPTEIWDVSVNRSECFQNIPVVKPQIDNLTDSDTVLLLLSDTAVASEVYELLSGDTRDRLILYFDLLDWLAEYYYPNK